MIFFVPFHHLDSRRWSFLGADLECWGSDPFDEELKMLYKWRNFEMNGGYERNLVAAVF